MTGIWAPWQAREETCLKPKDLFMSLLSCLFFLMGLIYALNTSFLALFVLNS